MQDEDTQKQAATTDNTVKGAQTLMRARHSGRGDRRTDPRRRSGAQAER
jgi:hypothetical protein